MSLRVRRIVAEDVGGGAGIIDGMPADELVLLSVGHRHETVAALTAQGRIGCGFCEEDVDTVRVGPAPPPRQLRTGKVESNYGLANAKLQRTLLWPIAARMAGATEPTATAAMLAHVASSVRGMKEHAGVVKALEGTRATTYPWRFVRSAEPGHAVDKIGGDPTGLGDAPWPACACCGQPMLFLAQLRTAPGTALPTRKPGMLSIFVCTSYPRGTSKEICPTWDEKKGANAVVFRADAGTPSARAAEVGLGATYHLAYDALTRLPKPSTSDFKSALERTLARLLWTAETGGVDGADDDDDEAEVDDGRSPFESRLGGAPRWTRSSRVIRCEDCKKPMPFVAQIDLASGPISDHLDLGDGPVAYVFFCPRHEKGKMLWQGIGTVV